MSAHGDCIINDGELSILASRMHSSGGGGGGGARNIYFSTTPAASSASRRHVGQTLAREGGGEGTANGRWVSGFT
jgi:hypothetical protein